MKTKRTRTNDLTRNEMEPLFQKYIPLAHHLAGKFSRVYKLPLPEVQDEAVSIWAATVAEWPYRYDARKSNPTSWAYRHIYWKLLDHCTRHAPTETTFTNLQRDGQRSPIAGIPHKTSWLESLLHTLGEDARIVVNTILFAPAEIVNDILPHTTSRAVVEDYLEDHLDWPMGRVAQAWREVESAMGTT